MPGMTTAAPPAPVQLGTWLRSHFPTLREVAMALPDPRVAITAIIAAAFVVVSVIAGLVVVAAKAGDVGAFAIAIGMALSAVAGAVVKIRGSSGNSSGGQ